MLVIALCKGRFLDPSLELLARAGIKFSEDLSTSRKLIFDSDDKRHRAFLVKPMDVPTYVEYGAADIVTKKKYRDFRLHIEFLIMKPGGNSGVYLQNRYEIQVFDGDKTKHGMGAVINESESPYQAYNGIGKWNAYDINFRAARFQDGKRVEKALVTMYFNGIKVHTNFPINQVWGGANSGVDGGNDNGRGITDTPQGLKLQAEGHDVRYRNIWIKETDLKESNTDFSEAQ